MSMTYKQDLRDIAVAVAQNSKAYTDKKIEDLRWELGTYDLSVDSVDGSTMLLPTPANATQMNINAVYGASEVSENEIILLSTRTVDGITFTNNNDGSYTLNGTAVRNVFFQVMALNITETYTIKNFGLADTNEIPMLYRFSSNGSNDLSLNSDNAYRSITTATSFTLRIQIGNTYNNFVIKPMLVKGSVEPTTFEPHFDGIHNFEWTGVKVEGFNIWDEQWENGRYDSSTGNPDVSELNVRSKNYIAVLPNTTYYCMDGGSGDLYILFFDDSNNIIITTNSVVGASSQDNNNFEVHNHTFTTPPNTSYAKFYCTRGYGATYNNNICINISGSANGTYVPYIAPTTTTIDLSSILYNGSPLFEDNCLKGYDGICDSITPYKATEKMHKIVVDENTGYTYISSSYRSATIRTTAPYKAPTTLFKCIWYGNDNIANINYESGGHLYITFTNAYASDTELKSAMLGVVIIYELATPIEVSIDWSSKLLRQTCYSNGSVTLTNTNNQDTTSNIDYLIEEVKA